MKFNKKDKITIVNTNDIWEGKKGIILSGIDGNEITEETVEYLVRVFFGDDKMITQEFSKDNLELDDENIREQILESKQEKEEKEKDFIRNYVYLEDIDDNIVQSWFFVEKLATAENISSDEVIDAAVRFKYKLFEVKLDSFKRIIVAAPKCKLETVEDEFADYVLGIPVVNELVTKEIR